MRRFLGDGAQARRALVRFDNDLIPTGPRLLSSPRGPVDLADSLEIFENLSQVSPSGVRRSSCDGTDPGVDRSSSAIGASRPTGECRSAVLTVIEFERRQLAAFPAEDPRHRAELGHDLVHVRVASAAEVDVPYALRHRRLTSLRAAAHRGFRASHIRQNWRGLRIRSESRFRYLHGGRRTAVAANALREPLRLGPR